MCDLDLCVEVEELDDECEEKDADVQVEADEVCPTLFERFHSDEDVDDDLRIEVGALETSSDEENTLSRDLRCCCNCPSNRTDFELLGLDLRLLLTLLFNGNDE
mmetsp:Transcript_15384/g.35457  ORF Transcript_15384/g.35457 Transcript_15384/m.35457 type:complete len:104 (-) Transcript_15384:846-1157(-)